METKHLLKPKEVQEEEGNHDGYDENRDEDQTAGYYGYEGIRAVVERTLRAVLHTVSERRGVLYGIMIGVLLGCQLSVVKAINMSPYQIMVYRSLFFLPCVLFVSWDKSSSYGVVDLLCYIAYGFFNTLGLLLAYVALNFAQIGNVTAISSNLPIPAALLAFCIFRETLSIFGLFFLTVNFIGLILVSKPPFLFPADASENVDDDVIGLFEDGDEFLGAMIAFAALTGLALSTIFSRKLSYRENVDAALLSFIPGMTGVLIPGAVLLFGQIWGYFHSVEEGLLCLLVAILSALGNVCIVLALKYEPVSLVTILFTLSAPVSFALGILAFDEIPDLLSVVGAILILISTFGFQWKK